MINAAIDSYVQRHSSTSSSSESINSQNSFDFQSDDGLNASEVGNFNSRWNVVDVEFFDFMYDDKSIDIDDFIAHISKNTYFKNVHYFIRRVNDITTMKKVDMIRQNLWTCLRNTVLAWWTGEFIDNEKLMITLIAESKNKLQQWTRMLHVKFKSSFNIVLKALQNERYTLRNAANRRELKKYAQKILRLAMNANLNNVKNQLDTIYNDIDSSFRKNDIKRSKNDFIINDILKDLNDCK